jgi:hypothetical protein
MIKISHEAPLFAFDQVQQNTKSDYFLVHMFNEIPEYFDKAIAAREAGRHIILDNSIFELGQAYNADEFKKWIELLKPTEYIVPDALEDAQTTVKNMQNWVADVPGKVIGVVQGKTLEELVWCYKEISPYVDKIAISFDYSYYETTGIRTKNKLKAWAVGRKQLLTDLTLYDIIDTSKPHHLLGASLPWEFINYSKYFPWIESLDTSNPVMWAIENGQYPEDIYSIETKPKNKLFTLMQWKPQAAVDILEKIDYNVNIFEHIVNGE